MASKVALGVAGFLGTCFLVGMIVGRARTPDWDSALATQKYLDRSARLSFPPDGVHATVDCDAATYTYDAATHQLSTSLDADRIARMSTPRRGFIGEARDLLAASIGAPVVLASAGKDVWVWSAELGGKQSTLVAAGAAILTASAFALGYAATYDGDPACSNPTVRATLLDTAVWSAVTNRGVVAHPRAHPLRIQPLMLPSWTDTALFRRRLLGPVQDLRSGD